MVMMVMVMMVMMVMKMMMVTGDCEGGEDDDVARKALLFEL